MTATAEPAANIPWWLVLIQGISLIIIGVLLLISPGMSTLILIQFLGIYWLIDGIFSLVRIFLKSSDVHWGWLLARGILGILAGMVVINNPLWATILVPSVLVLFLGIYGIIAGIAGIFEGFQGGGWGATILGAVSLIIGFILLGNRFAAAIALPPVIGIFAIVGGIGALVLAFRIR